MLRERRRTDTTNTAWREAADRALFLTVTRLITPFAPSGVTGAYWPLPGEPDSREALRQWHAAGWTLALPRVVARDRPLQFSRWTPQTAMVGGLMGTHEPAGDDELQPAVLVIPCLGFDSRGFRLGYGGGFYDRTLALMAEQGQQVLTIGVARDDARLSGFIPAAHDRPLDYIVTETGLAVAPERPAPP